MDYFKTLNTSLKNYKRAIPSLLVDLDVLDKNIATLKASLRNEMNFRLVVKSLPSFELIKYILEKTNTKGLMVFHEPFLTDLVKNGQSDWNVLMGKPMPIQTIRFFYKNIQSQKAQIHPFQNIQWLVDTEERLKEYIELAKTLKQPLKINLELDVGLHRGGFRTVEDLKSALVIIQNHSTLINFRGLMGYEPHIVKLPKVVRSPQKALQLANDFYKKCKTLIREEFPLFWKNDLTFNGGGSPTLTLQANGNAPFNDISAGSCLVKPSDFDILTLEKYEPACFISTPILKKIEGTTLPAMENFKGFWNRIDKSHEMTYFIYGGYWKAKYWYPKVLKINTLFGESTNQTMLNAPKKLHLEVNDFIFLRPKQSEFVFLQFGNILTVRNGKVADEWRLLKQF